MNEREKKAFDLCNAKIAEHNFALELKDVKYEGDEINFFFAVENKDDYRLLAQNLAGAFKTNVKLIMQQRV